MKPQRLFIVLAVALLSSVLVFYRIHLYSDRALLFRDLGRDFMVQKAFWARSVLAGNGIPFWNSYSFGGNPYWSNLPIAPLHPLNFIFLLFPNDTPQALNYFIWIHSVIFFCGAYFLLRILHVRWNLAILLAVSFAYSGFILSAHNLLHILSSLVAVPFFLAFFLLWIRESKLSRLLQASFFLAFPIYGGDPQYTYIMAFIAVAGISYRYHRRSLRHLCFYVLLIAISSAFASAAQMLPTIETMRSSVRTISGLQLNEILAFSFHPIRLVETFLPQFFGNRFGKESFWAEEYINFIYPYPFIFSTYLGSICIAFFFCALLLFFTQKKFRMPFNIFLVSAIFVGIILSFGVFSWLPLYEWSAKIVPFFSTFRYPERIIFWPILTILIFTSIHMRRIFLLLVLLRKRRDFFYLFSPAIFILISSSILASLIYFSVFNLPLVSAKSCLHGASALALLLLILFLVHIKKIAINAAVTLLIVFSISEFTIINSKILWDQSKRVTDGQRYKIVTTTLSDLETRSEELKHGAARRFSSIDLAGYLFLSDSMDAATIGTFSAYEGLFPNINMYYGIEDISGYFNFIPKEKLEFWRKIETETNSHKLIYDLMGVYYVAKRDKFQQIYIEKNMTALPYIFVPARVTFASSSAQTHNLLTSPQFNSSIDSVIENSEASPTTRDQSVMSKPNDFMITQRTGRIFSFTYQATPTALNRYLIWNETFNRNWHAYVNNNRTKIYKANAWAMAIELPASATNEPLQIEFRFENPWIWIGIACTAIWWIFFAAALILQRKQDSILAPSARSSAG